MEAPAITRYRRPFFAPVWLSLLAAAMLVAALGLAAYHGAGTTLVVLVQPAEKDPGTIADPPVSPEGEVRAQRIAHMFGDLGVATRLDAIYVSEDRRAQQTAAPLLERLHRSPVIFKDPEAEAVARHLLHERSGGAVLVIAGGAGFAQMLHTLAGAQRAVAPDDSDFIYVVSVPAFGRARLVRMRL